MARYIVDMRVDYTFEVEADSPEEAESLAWEFDYTEDGSYYNGVYSIDVEEVEEYIDESETVGEGKDE